MGLKQPIYRIDDLKLENDELLLNETIFHNANGYIGIRANFEEGYPKEYDTIRGTYINGFYDIARMPQAEKLHGLIEEKQTILNVADTQTIQLSMNGEVFSMFEGTVLNAERWLDMEQGITGRKVHWQSVSGKEIELTIKRMASFFQPSLFTIEYSVKALNFNGSLKITSHHLGDVRNYSNDKDPRVAAESPQYLQPGKAFLEDGITYLQSHTFGSDLSVCSAVAHVLSKDGRCDTVCCESSHQAVTTMEVSINAGETVTLQKFSVFSDSIRHRDCIGDAREKMTEALSRPMEEHYKNQRTYLKKFWEGCLLEIEGDDDLTTALNYNMYQLIQSVGKDEHCNIAAKGLSGEGYEGHYFWDTEMYMEPFFNLTAPEITKNLISFRYNTLAGARENARLMGH
ncbi:MAG: family 65 glycosyl hydrolase, partial [Mobilitalea sp.]